MNRRSLSGQSWNDRGEEVVLRVENLVKIYRRKKRGAKTNKGEEQKKETPKKLGPYRAVDKVSFYVKRGEIVGLLGKNGAGKSTCFRMTCGLIPANEGRIILNNTDVTTWPMHRRARDGMGYLPQERSTFDTLTTAQNIYAAGEFLGFPTRRAMVDACEAVIKKFNLNENGTLRDQIVGNGSTGGLSGGQRRRLEIARAMLAQPDVLLLDEPFANVDPQTIQGMQQEILRLAKEDNIGVLITDHEVTETIAITDRIYVICNGQVICSGPPREVLQNQKAIDSYFGRKAKEALAILDELEKQKTSFVPRGSALNERDDRSERQPSQRREESAYEERPRSSALLRRRERPSERNEFAPSRDERDASNEPRRDEPRRDERLASRLRRRNEPQTSVFQRPEISSANEGALRREFQERPSRPSLSLKGRETGEPKRTPSPRDEEPTKNRYSDALSERFRRAKDWENRGANEDDE